eukprot:Rhum_TRINITY_DN3375_c0_g1::Rhum_TRINITY_DN3375_c0_g1_i1::g.10486::m.10486
MTQRGGTAAGTDHVVENTILDECLAFSQPQAFADLMSSKNSAQALRQMRDHEMERILRAGAPNALAAMQLLQSSFSQVKNDGSLHPNLQSAVASYSTAATPIPSNVPLWENRTVLHATSTRLRRRFPAVQRAMKTLHRLYPATDVSAALLVAQRCSPHLRVLQRAARAQLAAAKERARDVEEERLDAMADAAEGRLVQVPHVLRQNTAGALKTAAYTKHLVLLRAVRSQRARMLAQARHRGGDAGGWRERHQGFVEDSDGEEPAVQYPEPSQGGVALLRRLAVADILLDVQFTLDGRVTTMRCVLNHPCGPFSQEQAEEAVDALRGEVLQAMKHHQMTPLALLHKKRLAAVDALQGSIESELSRCDGS